MLGTVSSIQTQTNFTTPCFLPTQTLKDSSMDPYRNWRTAQLLLILRYIYNIKCLLKLGNSYSHSPSDKAFWHYNFKIKSANYISKVLGYLNFTPKFEFYSLNLYFVYINNPLSIFFVKCYIN